MKNRTKLSAAAIAGFMGVLIISSSVFAATNPATADANGKSARKGHSAEHRAQKQANTEKRLTSKMDKLVADGTLTRDQADKITAKLKELKTNIRQEKRSAKLESREKLKDTIQKWLNDNDIEVELDTILPSRTDKHAAAAS